MIKCDQTQNTKGEQHWS